MSKNNQSDSLKKRYIFTLFSNLTSFGISFLSAGMVPRALTSTGLGIYSFLQNIFSQVYSFLEMGTSTAFYNILSRKNKEVKIITFYGLIMLVIVFVVVLFSVVVNSTGLNKIIFPQQTISNVYLVLLVCSSIFVLSIVQKISDALSLTVPYQVVLLCSNILFVASIFILYQFKLLDLNKYILLNILQPLGNMFCFFVIFISKKKDLLLLDWNLQRDEIKRYSKEIFHYSYPLLMYSLFGLITNLADRWIIQVYKGSVEQGFYGFSYGIGQVCFIFTSSLTPLLMREFSISHERNDLPNMADLFRRFIPVLYSLAAYFSCFLVFQTNKLVDFFGGETFQGAIFSIAIMLFYPIHQTYGQLSSSVFLATGTTKLYSNIRVIQLLIGLIGTILFLTPLGFNLGAQGLALKMVIIQFIGVNIALWFNCKYLKLRYINYLIHQIGIVLILLAESAVVKVVVDTLIKNAVFSFLISGFVYSILNLLLLGLFPFLFGVLEEDKKRIENEIIGRIKKLFSIRK